LEPSDIRLELCDLSLRDGIVEIVFKPCPVHGLEEAGALVTAHNELAQGVPRGVLADLTHITAPADRHAREHYVSEESARLKIGMAMITPSPFQRMLGNIFFRVNKPPYPCRMFQERGPALAWLRELEAGP